MYCTSIYAQIYTYVVTFTSGSSTAKTFFIGYKHRQLCNIIDLIIKNLTISFSACGSRQGRKVFTVHLKSWNTLTRF